MWLRLTNLYMEAGLIMAFVEKCVHTRSSFSRGVGGATGRGADAVHTREFGLLLLEPPRLESRVSASGKDLDVDSGESP